MMKHNPSPNRQATRLLLPTSTLHTNTKTSQPTSQALHSLFQHVLPLSVGQAAAFGSYAQVMAAAVAAANAPAGVIPAPPVAAAAALEEGGAGAGGDSGGGGAADGAAAGGDGGEGADGGGGEGVGEVDVPQMAESAFANASELAVQRVRLALQRHW